MNKDKKRCERRDQQFLQQKPKISNNYAEEDMSMKLHYRRYVEKYQGNKITRSKTKGWPVEEISL
ncbi:hypothetical protein Bca4012_078680 [Brassica carinata]